MTLFDFMGAHQILAFLLAMLISGTIVRIVRLVTGR